MCVCVCVCVLCVCMWKEKKRKEKQDEKLSGEYPTRRLLASQKRRNELPEVSRYLGRIDR